MDTDRNQRAFTLIELLAVIAILGLLAGLLLPALQQAKAKVHGSACLYNLKQWGLGMQIYAADHDDSLPDEGAATPNPNSIGRGWYVALPRALGLPPYPDMPWRTNALLRPGPSLFICPANPRRAANNNLFHYCLNEHVDGTGTNDHRVGLSSFTQPARLVYLFDNGKRAAVAQQNNVHTNLHQSGAQFLFLDGHTARFRNAEYWDFNLDKGRTNNPDLVWVP